MSTSDVDLVRRAYELFATTGELLEVATGPDFAWYPAADEPGAPVLHGLDEVGRLIQDWTESFDDFHPEIKEIEAHGSHVVVVLDISGRVHETDTTISIPETHVWDMRDGRAWRVREFRTKEEALASLD